MKKIFQLFILCVASIALISCGSRNFEGEIEEAVAANDFEQAHKILSECLDDLHKESDGLKQGIYVRCIVKVYTSEVNYLIESGDKSSSDRIIALYKEFSGKQMRETATFDMSDQEFGDYILNLALNTDNEYLIEKCLTSVGLYSPKSVLFILSHNSDSEDMILSELSSISIITTIGEGERADPDHYKVKEYKTMVNNHNQTCLAIINYAVRNNNKTIANSAFRLMKENLTSERGNYNAHYVPDDIEKAKSIIEEVFGNPIVSD